jgi:hypothetical protein
MEAIEQGHGGPEVLFANQKNDAAERTEWRMPSRRPQRSTGVPCVEHHRAHMCRSVLPDPAETPSFRRVVLCAPYGGNTDSLRF